MEPPGSLRAIWIGEELGSRGCEHLGLEYAGDSIARHLLAKGEDSDVNLFHLLDIQAAA